MLMARDRLSAVSRSVPQSAISEPWHINARALFTGSLDFILLLVVSPHAIEFSAGPCAGWEHAWDSRTGLAETGVIDHAIARVAEREIKVNIPHRIDSVYGRQLSVFGADGSRATVALFDDNGRLYQIESRAMPGAGDAATDTLRFQQSLVFTDGGSNRSPAAIRAIQEACRGVANPAGLDDPRCKAARR
jgi:hypothetical protein